MKENLKNYMYMTQSLCCTLAAAKLLQSCPTLCEPIDGGPPGSSVHGIFQARMLEWVAIYSSKGFSQPRDQTQVSCITGRFFSDWATREAPIIKNIMAQE